MSQTKTVSKKNKSTSSKAKATKPAAAVRAATAPTQAAKVPAAAPKAKQPVSKSTPEKTSDAARNMPLLRLGKGLFYLRDKPLENQTKGQPFGCVAFEISKENSKYTITYGISLLNKDHDNWNRELGRRIAQQRLEHHPSGKVVMTTNQIKETSKKYNIREDLFRKGELSLLMVLSSLKAGHEIKEHTLPRAVIRRVHEMINSLFTKLEDQV